MGLTWTRAPVVEPGEGITSAQMARLASAFNDRLRSGVGNMAWRVAMWWFNLFRQVRNPDASGLVFPAQGEFFALYQHLGPEAGFQWPVAGPGEPEGFNLGNPMGQFVFGLGDDLLPEADRVSEPWGVPLWLGFAPPATLGEWWELGKAQRGVIEPESNRQAVPAMEAAQSVWRFATPILSPHGKGYGGYFPQPEEIVQPGDVDSQCGTTEETGAGTPNFRIKFTALAAGVATDGKHGTVSVDGDGRAVVTYAGSCGFGHDYTGYGHVLFIARLPIAYYVFVNDGGGGVLVDRYGVKEWIEGPYEGAGVLGRYDGGQLQRAVWQFAGEFRGTPGQRAKDDFAIEEVAFDFQAFFERQYPLAPNLGRPDGELIEAAYPTARLAGAAEFPAGTLLEFDGGGTEHAYREGFVLAGMFARADGLAGELTLEVMDGEAVVATLTLRPDGGGVAEGMHWLRKAARPSPLRVRLGGVGRFADGGGLRFEATELMDYKPEWWDAYLVLRMSATRGGDVGAGGVDGRGLDAAGAAGMWTNLAALGCVANTAAAGARSQAEWINDNPVYDAARRLSREQVRILPRQPFLSYEVAGGKSVLRFRRWAEGYEGVVDLFAGIAPPAAAVERLEAGREYVVRGDGVVTYKGAAHRDGDVFRASTALDFQTEGEVAVHVREGIDRAARPGGWTNEWLMWLETKVYHPSESSIWKPAAYSDYFAWCQRCHFYSGSASSPQFRRHLTYNHRVGVELREDELGYDLRRQDMRTQADYIAPEAPDGYNYASGANGFYGSEAFYRSCQVFKKPYEVESATVEWIGGVEVVRLELTERLQAHPDAPGSVAADPLAWSGGEVSALRAEDHRTDDNALREYARHRADGAYQASWKAGDAGLGSGVQLLPDNPFGSCYPSFFFVKLVPNPHEDGNETQEPTDTRATVDAFTQMEIMLKAGCEGFVDGVTSQEITCRTGTGGLYDYTFEALCHEAFGGRWIGAFSLGARPDNPAGYGPLPNTVMYAEVFNRIASAVNALTRARIWLPFELECRTKEAYLEQSIGASWPDDVECASNPASQWRMVWSGSPPAPNMEAAAWGGWTSCGLTVSASSSAAVMTSQCSGANFIVRTDQSVVEYRVAITGDAELALRPELREAVRDLGGVFATWSGGELRPFCNAVGSSAEADGCCFSYQAPCPGWFWDSEAELGYTCGTVEKLEEEKCMMIRTGVLNAGLPPGGTFSAARGLVGAGGAAAECASGALIYRNLALNTDPGFWIEVPLA